MKSEIVCILALPFLLRKWATQKGKEWNERLSVPCVLTSFWL